MKSFLIQVWPSAVVALLCLTPVVIILRTVYTLRSEPETKETDAYRIHLVEDTVELPKEVELAS